MSKFKTSSIRKYLFGALGAVCLITWTSGLRAAELQPETLKAWQRYVQSADQNMKARLIAGRPFLWMDENPGREAQLIEKGAMQVAPGNGTGAEPVPNGLVHHWVGAIFIPNTTIDQVLKTTRDYDNYKTYFNPAVIRSEALVQAGDEDEFSLLWASKVMFISAGVDTQCLARSVRVDDRRSYKTSVTTRVQEVQNYGKPDEHEMAPDQGNGFIWRLYSTNRYEARNGGVLFEIETLALTRDIPASLRFFVAPVIKRISRNAMLLSLQQTRDAVGSSAQMAQSKPEHAPAFRPGQPHHGGDSLTRSFQ